MKRKRISMTLLALALAVSNVNVPVLKAADTPLSVEIPALNPTPQVVKKLGDGFALTKNINLVGGNVADRFAVNELSAFLEANGFTVNAGKDENSTTIIIGEAADEIPEMDEMQAALDLQDASELKADGYVLAANDNDIMIEGTDETGTFYGVKTLKAIVQTKDGAKVTPEVAIIDEPDMKDRGIVEGFYGTPWTHEQRLDQIRFYGDNKLNLYIYAPKDDPYHREKWREPYPESEMERMQELINTAKENKVNFVFAISPGIDIRFDGAEGEEDIQALLGKAESMYAMGVRSFAIYFDDIADRSGDKQAGVLNQFNERFVKVKKDVTPLITVPTEYFASGMLHEGNKSPYTAAFADNLDADIEVMWTGKEVVSQGVSNEEAELVSKIYGDRKMDLWWNYPVTDYNTKKLALGPVYGLESGIDESVSMLAINPMEFAETSKISIATGADFGWNTDAYDAEASFRKAINSLYGENAEDFTYFADHTTRVDTGRPDSPKMQEMVDTYYDKVMSGADSSAERKAIIDEFAQMKAVSKRLLNNLPEAVLKETSKQLTVFAKDAEYGERAMQMMDCILDGNVQQWWVLKQQSLKDLQSMKDANATVSGVVRDFINKAHTNGNILYDNTIPKDEKEIISYTASASMEAQNYTAWWYNARPYEPDNFAIENNDKAYRSKDNAAAGSWIQIDLEKETAINSIYLLQGRTERDNAVKGTFSYSADGENWTAVDGTYADYETIISDLDINARYVRFQAVADEDFEWFVRSFKVNRDVKNETAVSDIEGYAGTVSRRVENQNESGTKFATVIEADYEAETSVKAGDTFVLTLRDFNYIQDVKADFSVKGVVEYTRDDVEWTEATAENLAETPIASKVRFRATEDGKVVNASLTVTLKERNMGTYTATYRFDETDFAAINNFDIADVAVDSSSVNPDQSLTLDLGETTRINNMKLVFNEAYGGDRPLDVTFTYSVDGENWEKLPFNLYSWYNEYTGLDFNARYVKFKVNQGRGGIWTRIGEFSVNGSLPEAVWETSVNGKQPTNRVTNMNDRDLSTSYIPDSDVKAGDSVIYHFNKDRDLKRLHVLQDSGSITNAKVYAYTVNKEEVYMGELNEAYTVLDMPEHVDVTSVRIEFVKAAAVDGEQGIEIYELTPEFYTLEEAKAKAEAEIARAERELKNLKGNAKKEVRKAIDELKALLADSTDRSEIYEGIGRLEDVLEQNLGSLPVDKTELESAVKAAERLSMGGYTQTSKKAFMAARDSAKKVLKDNNATEKEVAEALEELLAAQENLTKK